MSEREINAKVKKIKALQLKADELNAEIERLKDDVKATVSKRFTIS